MKVGYVDSSCLVAIAFGEAGSGELAAELGSFDLLLSSNLLEAELRSALVRERVAEAPDALLDALGWVLPDRPLSAELVEVLRAGHLRGADLWHLACALMLRADLPEMGFLTLDTPQAQVAAQLGFTGLGSGPPG